MLNKLSRILVLHRRADRTVFVETSTIKLCARVEILSPVYHRIADPSALSTQNVYKIVLVTNTNAPILVLELVVLAPIVGLSIIIRCAVVPKA